jgi:transposase InsO family protein
MPHANACLTPRGRLRVAQAVIDQGWSQARAAERFQCSRTTVRRWVARYQTDGPAGMLDHSSRPHHSPTRTPARLVRQIVRLRLRLRLGPVQLAARVGLAVSTVHRVLVRCQLNRLAWCDRATGEPIRRYEHPTPGALVHIDIKKLGNIPNGGGHRLLGRATGRRHSQHHQGRPRTSPGRPNLGYGYVHAAVDDHSRLAYAEVHDNETAATAVGFYQRAHAWYASHGITVQRVLTDNGSAYISHAWRDALARLGVSHRRTRKRRPQTNGKVERFNRTLLNEWAYKRLYTSEPARRAALPAWLHIYNHHRPHTGIGGRPPITRCTNVPGQYS